jgi:formate hydrogenlyase subunit 6/NADH:ubiquinone oxidoreductase subunit I
MATALLTWIREILDALHSTAVGLRTTAQFAAESWGGRRSAGRGVMTRQYPDEKAVLAERFRGHLFNDVDNCITCKLCEKACPVDCFVIDGERTEDNKLRPSRFDIDLTKCIYCSLCTRACPTDCLTMTDDFEVDPRNGVNKRGGRYLFLQAPDQIDVRLEAKDMERLWEIGSKPATDLATDERAFLDRIESPKGTTIMGKYGMGYYSAEEKARVEAAREAAKKAKEEAAAKAKAAKAAADAAKAAEAKPAEAPKPPAGGAA